MLISRLRSCSVFLMLILSLTACTAPDSGAIQAVNTYLQALTEKDQDTLLANTCPSWETDALLELDALNLVKTNLKDVSCQVISSENNTTLVGCQGSIEATYGTEVQTLDLSQRVFQVENVSGDWLVCGYK